MEFLLEALNNFATDISPALQELLTAVAVWLVAQVTMYFREQYKLRKAELSREHQYILEIIAQNAVQAAEQLYDSNEAKRAHAISIVEQALAKYGINLDLDVVVSAIESAVFSKNQSLVEPSPMDFHSG